MRCPHTGETLDCAFLRRFVDELGTLDVTSKRDRYQLEKISRYSRVAHNQLEARHRRAYNYREGYMTPVAPERAWSDDEMVRAGLMRQILKYVHLYTETKLGSGVSVDPQVTLVDYDPDVDPPYGAGDVSVLADALEMMMQDDD